MEPTTQGIGDINATGPGTAARYNAGKAPMDLVPLRIMAESINGEFARNGVKPHPALLALRELGDFQARRGGSDRLHEVLRHLGMGGWHECARVFDYGRRKYAEWNWARGMAWSSVLASAARHLIAMSLGEEHDTESGLPHRGHAFCNIVMLLTYERTYPEGDDRPAAGVLA